MMAPPNLKNAQGYDVCSGLMKPDTHLGQNARQIECQRCHPVGGADVLGVPQMTLSFRHGNSSPTVHRQAYGLMKLILKGSQRCKRRFETLFLLPAFQW